MGKLPVTETTTYYRRRVTGEAELNVTEEAAKGLTGWKADADGTFSGVLDDYEAVTVAVSNVARNRNAGATPREPFATYIPNIDMIFGQGLDQEISDFISSAPDSYAIDVGETVATWINIDSQTGRLTGTAPSVAATDELLKVNLIKGGQVVDYVYALVAVEDSLGLVVDTAPFFTPGTEIKTGMTKDELLNFANNGSYSGPSHTFATTNLEIVQRRWTFLGGQTLRVDGQIEYLDSVRVRAGVNVDIGGGNTQQVTVYGPEQLVTKSPDIEVMLAAGNSNSNNARPARKALHKLLMGTSLHVCHGSIAGGNPSQIFTNSKTFAKESNNFDDRPTEVGGQRAASPLDFRSELAAAPPGTFTAVQFQLNNGYRPDATLFTFWLEDSGIPYADSMEEIVFQILDEMAAHEPEKGLFLTTVWPQDGPTTAAEAAFSADPTSWWQRVDDTVTINQEVILRYAVDRINRDLPVPRIRQIPADVLVQALRDASTQNPKPLWAQELEDLAPHSVNSATPPDGETEPVLYNFEADANVLIFGGNEERYFMDPPGSIHMAVWAKWTYACMDAAIFAQRSCVGLTGDRALFAENYSAVSYMELYDGIETGFPDGSKTVVPTKGAQGRRPEDLSRAAQLELQRLAMEVVENHPFTGYTPRPAPVLKPTLPDLAIVFEQGNGMQTADLKEYLLNVTDAGAWVIKNPPAGVTVDRDTGILTANTTGFFAQSALDVTRWQNDGQVTIPGLTVEVTENLNAPIDVVGLYSPTIFFDQTDPAVTTVEGGGALVADARIASLTSKGTTAAVLSETATAATPNPFTRPDLIDVGGTLLMDFDGEQSIFGGFGPDGALDVNSAYTAMFVYDTTSSQTQQGVFSLASKWGINITPGAFTTVPSATNMVLPAVAASGLHLAVFHFSGGVGGTASMWLRGAGTNQKATATSNGPAAGNARMIIGASGTLGQSPFTGQLGDPMMYDRALSQNARNDIAENYFYRKYNLGAWDPVNSPLT